MLTYSVHLRMVIEGRGEIGAFSPQDLNGVNHRLTVGKIFYHQLLMKG